MQIRAPFARIQIGDKATGNTFSTGDGRLRYVQVQIGEDKRASRCRFEVYDPGLQIGAKYFEISFKQGGIQVPPDLLSDPNPPASAESSAPGTSQMGSSAQDTSLTPEMRAFLDTIAYAEGTSGPDGYNTIFTHAKFQGYGQHPRQKKCSGRLCSDAAGRYQFLSSTWEGLKLPDFSPANQDKGAAKLIAYRGAAGDVQRGLPGLKDALRKCGLEWASLPGSPYGQPTKTYAQLEPIYKAALAKHKGGATPPQQQAAPPAPPPVAPPAGAKAAAQQTPLKDKSEVKPEEISNKGTEIIIELGYEESKLIAFHFIHTGTHTKGRQLDSTVFEGQCVRWLMTRRTKNTAHGNINLKELTAKIAGTYGVGVEMDGIGALLQHVDQTGLNDHDLLLREAKAIGYSVQSDKNKVVLKPPKPEFTNFLITQDILQDIQFGDKASKDMPANSGEGASPPSTAADSASADPKTKIDRLTGFAKQIKLEDTTAAGKGKAPSSSMSLSLETIDQAIADQKAKQQQTGQQTAAQTQATQTVATAVSKPDKQTNTKPVAVTGAPTKPVTGTPAPSSAKNTQAGEQSQPATDKPPVAEANAADATTGLPRQELGAIDLADGKAEAQEIADESRRVKGYESSATIKTVPEALTLAPGQIIGISKDVAPACFSREWRLSSVTHTLQGGKFTTDLDFYSPQKMKAEAATPTAGTAATGAATTGATASLGGPTTSSGWASPMKIAGNSSCSKICEFGYARGRLHAGIDYGGNGAPPDADGVFAASNGTVTYAGSMGGYGNTVDIKRPDGWSSRYAHLAKIDVKVGQSVNQGTRVGTRGNTGGNYAIHLHFEIRDPGGNPQDPRKFLPKPQIPIAG